MRCKRDVKLRHRREKWARVAHFLLFRLVILLAKERGAPTTV